MLGQFVEGGFVKKVIHATAVVAGFLFATVLLSGCLEVLHYVGSSPGGDVEVRVRMTFQKAPFSLAGAMMDGDTDEMFFSEEFGEIDQEFLSQLPAATEASVLTVNTPYEFGFDAEFSYSGGVTRGTADDAPFALVRTPAGFEIAIPGGNDDSGDDEMARAFLMSNKYRIVISRSVLPSIREAELVAPTETIVIDPIVLADVVILEFPIYYWIASGGDLRVAIR